MFPKQNPRSKPTATHPWQKQNRRQYRKCKTSGCKKGAQFGSAFCPACIGVDFVCRDENDFWNEVEN